MLPIDPMKVQVTRENRQDNGKTNTRFLRNQREKSTELFHRNSK